MTGQGVGSFKEWRVAARAALAAGRVPEQLLWDDSDGQQSLLHLTTTANRTPSTPSAFVVPPVFVALAETVALFRDPSRWTLLYRVLWRLTHGEPHLLAIECDADVLQMQRMAKAVRLDIHKMHAFVRFQPVTTGNETHFVAWHRPDHLIVEAGASFFIRRFAGLRWSLLTEDRCAHWDGRQLSLTAGVPRQNAPSLDGIESLWKTYYASIFNPGRLKIGMMKKEMAVRYWPTLPETTLIPDLIRRASTRVETMQAPRISAANYIPPDATMSRLSAAAQNCRGCDLCQSATQTVFGEGPWTAKIVLVGEQPGDEEDRVGRPFVGPAGRLLDQALAEAGLSRASLYLTNVVKHFRFEARGKLRLHKKASTAQIQACRPWLKAELAQIKPETIICLGATAAQTLMGRALTLREVRGKFWAHAFCRRLLITLHPSALLRWPDPDTQQVEYARFVAELKLASTPVATALERL